MVLSIQSIIIIAIGIIINIVLLKYITGTFYSEDKMRGKPGISGSQGLKGLYGIPGELGDRGPSGDPGEQGPQGRQGVLGGQGTIYKYGNINTTPEWWESIDDDNKFFKMTNTKPITKIKPCVQCPGWDPLPHWSVNGYCSNPSNCILDR